MNRVAFSVKISGSSQIDILAFHESNACPMSHIDDKGTAEPLELLGADCPDIDAVNF